MPRGIQEPHRPRPVSVHAVVSDSLPTQMEALAEIAEQNARNLWLSDDLEAVSDEQWQRVLVNVATRMRLRGVELPDGWQAKLTQYVGRGDV